MYRLLIILMILLSACGKIKNKAEKVVEQTKDKIINEIKKPVIKKADLFDKFPELKDKKFNIISNQGIECEYLPSFYKYYFSYDGNIGMILDFVSHIKCTYSEIIPDTVCKRIDFGDFQKEVSGLTEYEKQRADFFYKYMLSNTADLEIYNCIKTPEQHFIIFDKKSGRIYHMIENFKE